MANKLHKTVRFYGKLNNNQFAYAEFYLQQDTMNDKPFYKMAFVVADHPKTARYWLLGKRNLADKMPLGITGKGDLEALLWARDVLLDFINNFLPKGASVVIEGADKKRYSAYRRYVLKKLTGFQECYLYNEEELFLLYVKQ